MESETVTALVQLTCTSVKKSSSVLGFRGYCVNGSTKRRKNIN